MNWNTYIATVLVNNIQDHVIVIAQNIREAIDQVELKYPNSTPEIISIFKGGQQ